MPTYRNDGSGPKQVQNLDGNYEQVAAGASIETYHQQTDGDLTQTAATPYWNPVIKRTSISSTGAADPKTEAVGVAATKSIKIWKIVGGTVTIYNEASANTPALAVLRPGDEFEIDTEGKIRQLYMTFSAACTCEVVHGAMAIK
jgi:hypothetical protein